MKEHRYEIELTGHASPFKWKLFSIVYGKPRTVVRVESYAEVESNGGKTFVSKMVDLTGEAGTREGAIEAATMAARQSHWDLEHAATRETIVVLSIPIVPDAAELERMLRPSTEEPSHPPAASPKATASSEWSPVDVARIMRDNNVRVTPEFPDYEGMD